MTQPLEDNALAAVAALAAEYLDPGERMVHLSFTKEELAFIQGAEVRFGRGLEPHPEQLMVSVNFKAAR